MAAIVARFVGASGHSAPEYRALGYDDATLTFEHSSPFRVGSSRVGDFLTHGGGWPWVVTVHAQSRGTVRDTLLRCVFNARRPAHSLFLFELT